MNDALKKHLLEESKAMLAESRKALVNFDAHLNECIVDVEEDANVHPVRRKTQRAVLGLNVIQKALEAHETRKRTLAEAHAEEGASSSQPDSNVASVSTETEAAATSRSISSALLTAQIAEDEERVRADLERAEMLRIEAEKAEQRRLQVERALEEEREVLTRIEREREELKRKVAAEQQEIARLEEERAEIERKQALAREEQARRAREEAEALESRRVAEEAEAAKLAAVKAAAEAKRLEDERLEKERLEKARVEKEEKERLANEERLEKERLENERLEKEKERLEKERLENERLEKEKERLEKEKREQEEAQARQENERLLAAAAAAESESRSLPQGKEERLPEEEEEDDDDAERALQEALAEKALLDESMNQQGEDEEEYQLKSNVSERVFDPETVDQAASDAPSNFEEKKYVTISDIMQQPGRSRMGFSRTLKLRVLVLREDKFRFYDETQSKMLGGLSLADDGVEVVLTAVKKSPSGLSLRFSSPATGMLEFYPKNEEMGRKWIKAVEHNLEMRYELPDLGPEEALTYYDYLGVQPDLADSSTLLQAYADKTRTLRDEAFKNKLDAALQVLNDPFKRVEYDNFITVQRKYRFGAPATVQIKTPRGESTEAIASRVFTDASFSYLFWQDIRLGASLTGRHLCVELVRIQEVQPGATSNAVNLLLNNGEILIFLFKEKREAEDFGAAVRFAKSPHLSSAKKRQSVVETSV